MRNVLACLVLVASAASLSAADRQSVRVVASPTQRGSVDVTVEESSILAALKAIELHLDRPVALEFRGDWPVSLVLKRVKPVEALYALALQERLEVEKRSTYYILREADEPTVTIDVKDAEVRAILNELKTQCGIRNVIVDPNVSGNGTFLFTDVPCSVAFKTVFSSLGLAVDIEPHSLIHVQKKKR